MFLFPHEIPGWLSEAEGAALYRLAARKRVLEIGSYCGRSTVCLASSASSVRCIDPMDGRATRGNDLDTRAVFRDSLERYGLAGKVTLSVGTTAEVAPALNGDVFDLVFIDGDHSAEALKVDVACAIARLAPGGLIAFHDYRREIDPAVTVVVDGLVAAGASLVEVVDHLAVVSLTPMPEPQRRPFRVLLGMPRYSDDASLGAAMAFAAAAGPECETVESRGVSLAISSLTGAFNNLWALARNEWESGRVDGFAMIHSDVAPQPGWLARLYHEMNKADADLISVVVPIKDERGLSSTAIDDSGDEWRVRRLTMAQVHTLPETFTDEDVGGPLLLNTGLWMCRLGPWCLDVHFRWTDCLRREPHPSDPPALRALGGRWVARSKPEDYDFSRQCRAQGLKLAATRAIPVRHWGMQCWSSEDVWGWQVDQEVKKAPARKERAGV